MAKRKKDYDTMTLEELRTEAAAQGVEGRSSMHKDELVAALKGTADTPSNTTSGGETPEATDEPATVEGGTPKGAAHYPPSASDSSGEKTDNIPPSKRLPPDVPPGEGGADELTRLRAEHAALSGVVKNLGGNPEEVARQASAKLAQSQQAKAGPTKKATVTPQGGAGVEVEYPADTPKDERDAAAVEAYKRVAGIWSMPSQPGVTHHD